MGDVGTGAYRELVSGWIKHNITVSRWTIDKESPPARTECTYLILYESAEDDDTERKISELRERLSQVLVSPDVKKELFMPPWWYA